jgi:protein involved in polysaccharide export with SLBB domain
LIQGKPVIIKMDLNKAIKEGDFRQAPPVQPGDLLYIPSRRRTNLLSTIGSAVGLATSIATAAYYLTR